jgi:hypothetical protein
MDDLIAQYPIILYLLLCLSILVFPLVAVLGLVGFVQGREFSTPLFKVGARPAPTPPLGVPSDQLHTPMTEDQLADIAERVRAKLDEYKKEEGLTDETLLLKLPNLPKHTIDLFAMKVAIGQRVREIVLSYGGAWAGSSWASLDTYFELAQNLGVLDKQLVEDIGSFDWVITPGIYGDEIGEDQFRDASQLASKILRQLEKIEPGPMAMG